MKSLRDIKRSSSISLSFILSLIDSYTTVEYGSPSTGNTASLVNICLFGVCVFDVEDGESLSTPGAKRGIQWN